jgi:hypothetical protein
VSFVTHVIHATCVFVNKQELSVLIVYLAHIYVFEEIIVLEHLHHFSIIYKP